MSDVEDLVGGTSVSGITRLATVFHNLQQLVLDDEGRTAHITLAVPAAASLRQENANRTAQPEGVNRSV
jgi:hypothetical protein